jgi:bifunctional ADP-heptose synthase (sugar kinase/adenylyltransferase)
MPLAESAAVEDVGGRTVILPLYHSESTTQVIERIVARNGAR